jgi:hypothetical protein
VCFKKSGLKSLIVKKEIEGDDGESDFDFDDDESVASQPQGVQYSYFIELKITSMPSELEQRNRISIVLDALIEHRVIANVSANISSKFYAKLSISSVSSEKKYKQSKSALDMDIDFE